MAEEKQNELVVLLENIGTIMSDPEKRTRVYDKISKVNLDLEATQEFRKNLYTLNAVLHVLSEG